ncbi:cupin domain-containing protein [bacterium]|nr:cupin domain-containing protein [bacterium]
MPSIFKSGNQNFQSDNIRPKEFDILTAVPKLSKIAGSTQLEFDIRELKPNTFSFPYHFHHFVEEIVVILSGEMTLRDNEGKRKLEQGDIVFFEKGKEGAHQFYNDSAENCTYLDIKTEVGFDVCEYPDSNKIYVCNELGIYRKEDKVDYFNGEEQVEQIWNDLSD